MAKRMARRNALIALFVCLYTFVTLRSLALALSFSCALFLLAFCLSPPFVTNCFFLCAVASAARALLLLRLLLFFVVNCTRAVRLFCFCFCTFSVEFVNWSILATVPCLSLPLSFSFFPSSAPIPFAIPTRVHKIRNVKFIGALSVLCPPTPLCHSGHSQTVGESFVFCFPLSVSLFLSVLLFVSSAATQIKINNFPLLELNEPRPAGESALLMTRWICQSDSPFSSLYTLHRPRLIALLRNKNNAKV